MIPAPGVVPLPRGTREWPPPAYAVIRADGTEITRVPVFTWRALHEANARAAAEHREQWTVR